MTKGSDFILCDGEDYPQSQLELDMKDIQNIHIYRGRFIHYMSFIELVLKRTLNRENSRDTFGRLYPKYLKFLKKKGVPKEVLRKFQKDLKEINDERIRWAHKTIKYKKRTSKRVANNYLDTIPLKDYFDKLSKILNRILQFLSRSRLIVLLPGENLEAYSVTSNSYPRIKR